MQRLADLDLETITVDVDGDGIATVRLNRPDKRNALDLSTIEQFVSIFNALPREGVRAVVLCAAGDHFSAGLDLVEHHRQDRTAADFMHVCLRWHEAFNKIEYSGIPVIAALKGAVVGGGLAYLETGDTVRLDLGASRMDAVVDDAEWAARKEAWSPPKLEHQTPWQEIYRTHVGQLAQGGCLELATAYQRVREALPRVRGAAPDRNVASTHRALNGGKAPSVLWLERMTMARNGPLAPRTLPVETLRRPRISNLSPNG